MFTSYFCDRALMLKGKLRLFATAAQLSFKRKCYFEVLCRSRIAVRRPMSAVMLPI